MTFHGIKSSLNNVVKQLTNHIISPVKNKYYLKCGIQGWCMHIFLQTTLYLFSITITSLKLLVQFRGVQMIYLLFCLFNSPQLHFTPNINFVSQWYFGEYLPNIAFNPILNTQGASVDAFWLSWRQGIYSCKTVQAESEHVGYRGTFPWTRRLNFALCAALPLNMISKAL